ncbi:MAG: biotin-dependent carboxyltransferase family protein [Halioglobus sp.]
MSLEVIKSGVLCLLQDAGRYGHHRLGLTEGGPMDAEAFAYCNRLLANPTTATAIEISVGGAQFRAHASTFFCVTGASAALTINDEPAALWQVHTVEAGDIIALGYANRGCRLYLGIADGFDIQPQFGSTATVVREGIGGLNGAALEPGDVVPFSTPFSTGATPPAPEDGKRRRLHLAEQSQPRYSNSLTVRVVPGYQQRLFSRTEQRRFFGGPYTVSNASDRMGYQLEGQAISCSTSQLLSEGICYGAIQIQGNGQPIVLLNDRQTIGGYPKIGTALSLDAARLSQMTPGSTVYFAPITPHTARRALQLAQRFLQNKPLVEAT